MLIDRLRTLSVVEPDELWHSWAHGASRGEANRSESPGGMTTAEMTAEKEIRVSDEFLGCGDSSVCRVRIRVLEVPISSSL